jgi:hypothetical protein
MQYSMEGKTEADLNNRILFFKQEVIAPARLAGGILLVGETLDQVKEHRNAWLYNPGQRRVRRAPNVAYDNPGTAADGMRTSDQFDMYNGAIPTATTGNSSAARKSTSPTTPTSCRIPA